MDKLFSNWSKIQNVIRHEFESKFAKKLSRHDNL